MGPGRSRIVLVIGREPNVDVAHVAAQAVAGAHGTLGVLVVGDRPNAAQADVMDRLLRMSSNWLDALLVHDVGLSEIGDDDEIVIAASGREREVLEMILLPPQRAAG